MHEAIIDEEIFKKVQIIMKERTRVNVNTGIIHNFSGKVFCLECNRYMRKKNSSKHEYLVCSQISNGYDNCINKHGIRYDKLEDIVLNEINKKIKKYYNEEILEQEFSKKDNNRFSDKIKSLEYQKDEIIKKKGKVKNYLINLYEDKVNGIINGNQFKILIKNYNEEENVYDNQIECIDNEINSYKEKEKLKNNNKNLFNKYKQLESLNRVIVQEFIDKIYIGKISVGTNERIIKIKWNFE